LRTSVKERQLRKYFRSENFSKYFLIGILLLTPALAAADSDRAKAVGSNLMCICGCQQVLTECNHIHCPSSVPMRGEVNDKLAAGMTDDQVLKSFVEKYGTIVLAAPGWGGLFNKTAWFTPFAALLAGFAGLIFYLRRVKSTTVPSAQTSVEASAYDKKIEDELNKFTPED
jgi:cytochrome c-type biogenesis protein CcmH/NrfF